MARGKQTDPTQAVLVTVMDQLGFAPELIATASGLPRGTVKDIIQGNGPWRQMPHSELHDLTRLRVISILDGVVGDLAIKAMAKLEKKLETALFVELINFVDVGLKERDAWR